MYFQFFKDFQGVQVYCWNFQDLQVKWPQLQEMWPLFKNVQETHYILLYSATGAFLRIPFFESLNDFEYFEDGKYWEIEEDEEEDDEVKEGISNEAK